MSDREAPRHAVNDVGDCMSWCHACRESRAEYPLDTDLAKQLGPIARNPVTTRAANSDPPFREGLSEAVFRERIGPTDRLVAMSDTASMADYRAIAIDLKRELLIIGWWTDYLARGRWNGSGGEHPTTYSAVRDAIDNNRPTEIAETLIGLNNFDRAAMSEVDLAASRRARDPDQPFRDREQPTLTVRAVAPGAGTLADVMRASAQRAEADPEAETRSWTAQRAEIDVLREAISKIAKLVAAPDGTSLTELVARVEGSVANRKEAADLRSKLDALSDSSLAMELRRANRTILELEANAGFDLCGEVIELAWPPHERYADDGPYTRDRYGATQAVKDLRAGYTGYRAQALNVAPNSTEGVRMLERGQKLALEAIRLRADLAKAENNAKVAKDLSERMSKGHMDVLSQIAAAAGYHAEDKVNYAVVLAAVEDLSREEKRLRGQLDEVTGIARRSADMADMADGNLAMMNNAWMDVVAALGLEGYDSGSDKVLAAIHSLKALSAGLAATIERSGAAVVDGIPAKSLVARLRERADGATNALRAIADAAGIPIEHEVTFDTTIDCVRTMAAELGRLRGAGCAGCPLRQEILDVLGYTGEDRDVAADVLALNEELNRYGALAARRAADLHAIAERLEVYNPRDAHELVLPRIDAAIESMRRRFASALALWGMIEQAVGEPGSPEALAERIREFRRKAETQIPTQEKIRDRTAEVREAATDLADWCGEPAAQLIARIGTNASLWATEFCKINHRKGIGLHRGAQVGVGEMIVWFANAIETGRAAGRESAMVDDPADPAPISDYLTPKE